jgi:hypothetical protein
MEKQLTSAQKIKLAAFALVTVIVLSVATWFIFHRNQSSHSQAQVTHDVLASLQVKDTYAAAPPADQATFLKQGMTTLGFSDPKQQQTLTPEVVTSACLTSKNNEVRSIATQNAKYYKTHTDEYKAMQQAAFHYCQETYSADGKMPDMPAMHEH